MQSYKYDARYGFLVVTIFPLNILVLHFTPLLFLIKDEEMLQKMNHALVFIGYIHIATILTIIYFALNLTMIPFAYLATI